jgi:hypothetical protein
MENQITDKQLEVIEYIEENTLHVFSGTTKQEAREWIGLHIAESKIKTQRKSRSGRSCMDNLHWQQYGEEMAEANGFEVEEDGWEGADFDMNNNF